MRCSSTHHVVLAAVVDGFCVRAVLCVVGCCISTSIGLRVGAAMDFVIRANVKINVEGCYDEWMQYAVALGGQKEF